MGRHGSEFEGYTSRSAGGGAALTSLMRRDTDVVRALDFANEQLMDIYIYIIFLICISVYFYLHKHPPRFSCLHSTTYFFVAGTLHESLFRFLESDFCFFFGGG